MPDHAALTVQEAPTLYWFLSEDSVLPITFMLIEEESGERLFESSVLQPTRAGVHATRLSAHDVNLEPGKTYRWFVSLAEDPSDASQDVYTGGIIERVEPTSALLAAIERSPERATHAYAKAGIWYDAFESVSNLVATHPDDPKLRARRAALLDSSRPRAGGPLRHPAATMKEVGRGGVGRPESSDSESDERAL